MEIQISIIVPVYKIKTQFLKECIESLINQTCKNIEIILIDDGSEDDCSPICDRYSEADNRIRVIHQENKGVSIARNVGIQSAKGEWILFVDADDIAHPLMCEKILSFAKENNADIAMFSNFVLHKEGSYEHPFFEENINGFTKELREEFQLRTMILNFPGISYQPKYMLIGHTFGKLIKREYLIRSNILFDSELRLQQDGIFYLNLSECGGKMAYLNEPLYYYRVYDTSNCKKARKDIDVIYEKVRMAFMCFIKENNKPQIFYDAFYAKCITDISQYLKNDFFNKADSEPVYQRIRRLNRFLHNEPFRSAIIYTNKAYLAKMKRRNLFYYKHRLLWFLWLDWKVYELRFKLKNGVK